MNNREQCNGFSRRRFIQQSGALAGLCIPRLSYGQNARDVNTTKDTSMHITVKNTDSNFEREPLIRPFGFKGGYMTEIWQTAALLEEESGLRKIGLCSQSVLWSDAAIFASHSESGGNALMYAMTEHALRTARGMTFTTPIDLLDMVLGDVYEYGKAVTGNPDLRKTFALNALVGFDNAAWLVYAEKNGIGTFDDMIPPMYRSALSHHHKELASIPLMAYAVPVEEIRDAAGQGYFFMKIKIGQPGTQEEMLEKDKSRMTEIHKAIGNIETPYTKNGKLPYYFDANGRYARKETLLRLLDHARKIGAFDHIAIIEEPFPEEYEESVGDLGVRIAADESAHTDADAVKRIQMGYGAIALKAIAKTLSMTLKIAKVAHENGIPCFCADLTVNPILVDWNKNVAARLAPFPGLGLGLVETNGHQNYRNWEKMKGYHPCNGAPWTETRRGVFMLDKDFYEKSGGIFLPSGHYEDMFRYKG
ncbi:L-alanine-DL-glutamate epimerase [bacterium]|nr:L-alanine-DL-glutamate epimerase [bacterium]